MRVSVLIILLLVAGCTSYHEPAPKSYVGKVSVIKSSVGNKKSTSADLFYLSEINGQKVYSSKQATAEKDNGFFLNVKHIDINVPDKMTTFTIVGERINGALIQSIFTKSYYVKGKITFSPEPQETYVVKGELGKTSKVWLEAQSTGKPIMGQVFIKTEED
ncbi:hypothetical protein D5018_14885 [Parashewanella curva]|uniref:Lipoprotein n=2 Tax=Parashewanella curva TaxID=2338552 RepID=A0A3L8PTZ3_9GAMM|nr:hypothetical protein D5018_14885 [Parashewanella curva]